MNADRIYIFHAANGDNVSYLIAYRFKFYLFPAEYIFFDKYLVYRGRRKSCFRYNAELFYIICRTAARASESESGTDYYGIAYLIRNFEGGIYTVCDI